ncbi:HIT family protein [Jatrophihabitans fulvus]
MTSREPVEGCLLCEPDRAAAEFGRRTVWQDALWRLSVVERDSPVAGFAHLEPRRHLPEIVDLDGDEAESLGPTLARVTAALKKATSADLVYVYVFGERVRHLHFNLAPHRAGDALVGGPGLVRPGADTVPAGELIDVGRLIERTLAA